jgi:molybdopterin-containing oxidoreductase family iron-sulfur binding subunit
MNRRTFLKIAGMGSLAFASACTVEGEEKLYSVVKTPEDMITGKAHWYATTCRECPAGCGALAKNREGRVIKVEGNPLHPANRGKLCMRGQAAVQAVYNPDRLKQPLVKSGDTWQPLSFEAALSVIREKLQAGDGGQKSRVRLMSRVEGDSLSALFDECAERWNMAPPLYFEAFAYENLKKANSLVFGVDGLISYRIDQADFLLGFGADFLETWLSPVSYARGFKAMHVYKNGGKGLFYQASPYRSLTGANADRWFPCRPGTEAALCLGLIREFLSRGMGGALPPEAMAAVTDIAQPYTRQMVKTLSGVSEEDWEALTSALTAAEKPLVLGTPAASHSQYDLHTEIAVNLLNAILDPDLERLDFAARHRVEKAEGHQAAVRFFEEMEGEAPHILFLNQVNPLYTLPPKTPAESVIASEKTYVVNFTNFMDETAKISDLLFPVSLPLEEWGEYTSGQAVLSTLQPAMTPLWGAPSVGDVLLQFFEDKQARHASMKHYMLARLEERGLVGGRSGWLKNLRRGGIFPEEEGGEERAAASIKSDFKTAFDRDMQEFAEGPALLALPSIRYFDGRGANRPWLSEIPDPITKVAWQTTVMVHPETARLQDIENGNRVEIKSGERTISAYVFESENLIPGLYAMQFGQGHTAYGRYAEDRGANPVTLLSPTFDPLSGALMAAASPIFIDSVEKQRPLAHTDGSRSQHERKIALTVTVNDLESPKHHEKHGLAMWEFPLTLPLPEGYDPKRDFYPPHDHEDYRWSMVVDLDRCIGCNACAAACYAENNLGVVGEEQIINGREMSWIRIERYHQIDAPERLIFLPMLCQHCDNAPCESVCPVFAPHHSKEGLNNQIYNRCIGTRFCAQNCPYKVRKFNWYKWDFPEPLNLQLNPDVTARTKGVMEKCSFCIQRIKAGHNHAKNEGRLIKDGEVTPACVQTCPTDALVFGSLMDENSRVSKLVRDKRAYQVMGYLNTKPAVIYLKKVVG